MTGRKIAVLSTGRQDWSILRSTCLAIEAASTLDLELIIGGMHLSGAHGRTADLVRDDGLEPVAELEWMRDGADAVRQAARALQDVGAVLDRRRPAALLVAGDRFEVAAAALAATIQRVPIVHLHGGEQTEGAFDDALRHAITKLSHLHLVSHEEHARRVAAMGEEAGTIHVVGAPSLDAAFREDLADRAELENALGIRLEPPIVIVTVHPATLEADPAAVATPVAEAMDLVPATYIVTMPNTDPGGSTVRAVMAAAAARPGGVAVDALGERRYWGLLRLADAMLGNSSSGIVEAPAVDLPAVNVGDRQKGRRREANVKDVPEDAKAIAAALRDALWPGTRERVRAAHPPGLDGQVGRRIADIIAGWDPPLPPRKAPIKITR
jgi:UDP-hydrolysing UDP-N-acetyl-D-glucosamine 2-epimerase